MQPSCRRRFLTWHVNCGNRLILPLGRERMQADLTHGYPLEQPSMLVPWGLSRRQLVSVLGPYGLRKVDANNFVLACTSLSGLHHQLLFQYDLDHGQKKYLLRMYQSNPQDIRESYETCQLHLEMTFGRPSRSDETEDGFLHHTWNLGEFTVSHSVHERFGFCETIAVIPSLPAPSLLLKLLRCPGQFCRAAVCVFTFERFLPPRLLLLWIVWVILVILVLSRVR